MDTLIQEIHVEKISDKIVEQLEKLIKDGKVLPGNRLPSERQLIEMLGVGRSSLREAINRLEMMGYVEIRKRKGIYVKAIESTLRLGPLKQMLHDDKVKIIQLYEIRSDLEEASAFAAAEKRSKQDLESIKEYHGQFETEGGELQFSWELDQAFHSSIAQASRNYFRIHAISNIFDFSKEFIKPLIEGFADSGENLSIIIEQHNAIIDAIQQKNAEHARNQMKLHLDWTNRQLVNYFR